VSEGTGIATDVFVNVTSKESLNSYPQKVTTSLILVFVFNGSLFVVRVIDLVLPIIFPSASH